MKPPALPTIAADAVSVSYHSKVVLDAVSLKIAGGSIMGLVGPSGCGKTSFLSCINRLTDLVEGCRVSGRLTVGEEDVLSSRSRANFPAPQGGNDLPAPQPLPALDPKEP